MIRQDEHPAKHNDGNGRAGQFGSSGSPLVGEGGFEPPKSSTTDLQSAPFGHSGIPPYSLTVSFYNFACPEGSRNCGAGRGTRTHDLLITNQLLYQLSYTSMPYQRRLFYQRARCLSRIIFCPPEVFSSGGDLFFTTVCSRPERNHRASEDGAFRHPSPPLLRRGAYRRIQGPSFCAAAG